MTFEQKIFQHFCELIPGLTTRQFSQLCGRSNNYYCSLQSQNLPMSNTALIHLAEVLGYYKDLGKDKAHSQSIQNLLTEEIARRQQKTPRTSFEVQRLISQAFARIAMERDRAQSPLPISMGW